MTEPLHLTFPPELLDAIAAATTTRVLAELADRHEQAWPEWMSIETAARYLDVPVERIRKLVARRAIPFSQESLGCRLSFNRRELNAWMDANRTDPRSPR